MTKNEILNKSLDLQLKTNQVRNYLKWGFINFIILIILWTDISNQCYYITSKWLYVEYAIIGLVTINLIVYILKYIYHLITFDPVKGTIEQKKLLEFDDIDNSFVIDDGLQKIKVDIKPGPMNETILNWHSSFNDSNRSIGSRSWAAYNRSGSGGNTSSSSTYLNQSLNSGQNTSWNSSSFYKNSSFNLNQSGRISPNNTSFNSIYKKYLKDEIITDEKGLQKYLKEISKQEQLLDTSGTHGAHSTTFNAQSMNSFWNYYNTAANLLKTSLYQLSPLTTSISPIKQGGITSSGISSSSGLSSTSGKLENDFEGSPEILKLISPTKLSQYVANLRMWISITILQRLESEINSIDEAFKSRGFNDLQIGSVGLERLKKTAENQQFVSLHVPMLPLIVPFLEMSTNQEYLVQRIKDLSKGSCIADYRWNSGSSYHGLNWDEHLPTDSAILFHLFCTYLDTQLMPLPQPGGRPFYTRYVVIGDKKSAKDTLAEVSIKNKAKCAILCTNQLKPKFNFISDNKIHNCPYDRNNLFYVIIQFLFHMKNNHGGLLEGVNLGKSGINILCVIED